jgi:hypothetical protein
MPGANAAIRSPCTAWSRDSGQKCLRDSRSGVGTVARGGCSHSIRRSPNRGSHAHRPQNALLHDSIGRCLQETKDVATAIPELREALEKRRTLLGTTHWIRPSNRKASFRKRLSTAPRPPKARKTIQACCLESSARGIAEVSPGHVPAGRASRLVSGQMHLQPRQDNPALRLIFPLLVPITYFAVFI